MNLSYVSHIIQIIQVMNYFSCEAEESTSSNHRWMIDTLNATILTQIKSATEKNPNASTFFDLSIKVQNQLQILLDQNQLESIRWILSTMSDDYELEFDRFSSKNKARLRRKSATDSAVSVSDETFSNEESINAPKNGVQICTKVDVEKFTALLRHSAACETDKMLAKCKAKNLQLKYNSNEEQFLTFVEVKFAYKIINQWYTKIDMYM